MSHTPAPWTYQEESDAYTHIVRGPNNEYVCAAPQWTNGIAEANARLISASPELLDALKIAANLLTLYLPDEQTVGTAFKSKEAKERIHAAIAKATGGAQ